MSDGEPRNELVYLEEVIVRRNERIAKLEASLQMILDNAPNCDNACGELAREALSTTRAEGRVMNNEDEILKIEIELMEVKRRVKGWLTLCAFFAVTLFIVVVLQ